MISVCIPLYNYNAVPLVEALHRQCRQMAPGEVELVWLQEYTKFANPVSERDKAQSP